MRGWLRILVVLLLVSPFAEAPAQMVGAGLVVLASDHQPLGSPLIGGEIVLRARGVDSSFSLSFGGASLRGHADRFGSPCAGLVPPTADCAAQPLRDDARITAGSIGASLPIVRARRVRFSLVGDITLAQFQVASRRKSGGDALSADKLLIGACLGGEAAWYLSPHLPIAVEASMAVGAFRPVVGGQIVDGYEPFESGLRAHRVRLGLSWRVR